MPAADAHRYQSPRPHQAPVDRGIISLFRRACEHADATIDALGIDAAGHVPWWPRPDVTLFNVLVHVLVHVLTETSRQAGHADILREQLDSVVGTDADHSLQQHDAAEWAARRARIKRAARSVATRPR